MPTVTSKGQITLPKDVREALGLETGSQISFEVQPGQVILRKHVPEAIFERWRGFLQTKDRRLSTDKLMAELRDE